MERQTPGVTLGNVSGNDFQPDVSYRGFDATPVSGTPIGLAVYQNGVRINEAFGDTVNWDLIPTNAIDRTSVVSTDPAYGLNALGGAVLVNMKNGFTWQGFEADLRGGSFGRAQGLFQYGRQFGDYSVYLAGASIGDSGWRSDQLAQIRNFYGDVGYRANGAELHFNMTAADNFFDAAATAPLQLLQQNWGNVYTIPQSYHNQLAMFGLNGIYAAANTLNFQGNLYFRAFNQAHVDGNTTDVASCPPFLCLNGNPVHSSAGAIIPDLSADGTFDMGEIDRSWTQSRSVGGNLQAVDTDRLFGHDNQFTVGVSLDYGWTNFNGNSELGLIASTGNSFPVAGAGYTLDEPDSFLAPVSVRATNLYAGLYAVDTFNVTTALALTAGFRANYAAIDLKDQTGGLVNGVSTYSRINPVLGVTYQITPTISAYASYSEANRAPTPLELGCGDPDHPCIVDNFLTSDPYLQQIVARTFQAGLRGNRPLLDGKLQWSAGLFHTTLSNDILPQQSSANGFGYYANVGTTLRQGAELGANWRNDQWKVYANYTYINAVYESNFLEPSPFNPAADENGLIAVTPGTQIASIPRNTVKVGAEYALTDNWKIGADIVAASSQQIAGNENGALPPVPGYAILNLHASYQASKQLQLYGLIQNVLNTHYYTSGGLFDVTALPVTAPRLTDPRNFGNAMPFAIYGGLRYTM